MEVKNPEGPQTDVAKFEDRSPAEAGQLIPVADDPIMAAIHKGFDPAFIKEMMDLQERNEAREAKKAYVVAMSAFKANPPVILKDRNVSYGEGAKLTEYSHASLSNVASLIGTALSEHGLHAGWKTTQGEGNIKVTCTVTHILGHSESAELSAGPDNSGGKNSIQAVGSTISYLERYTILAITGLATKDMDDDGRKSEEVKFITPAQAKVINDIIAKKGVDIKKFLRYIKADSIEKILEKNYQYAMGELMAKKTTPVKK